MKTMTEFELVSSLQELVRINSQTDSIAEQQALDWFCQQLHIRRIDFERVPKMAGNGRIDGEYAAVIAKVEGVGGNLGKTAIISNGHIDVVGLGSGWTKSQGEMEGSIMYGRGTSDMKSGVIVQVAALDMFANSDDRSGCDQWALVVGSEETTSWGTQVAVKFCQKDWIDYRNLAAIILEPTSYIEELRDTAETKVMYGNKGCFSAEFVIKGDTGHAAGSTGKVNSIRLARDIDFVLEALGERWKAQYGNSPLGSPVLTPTIIHGGVAANSLPPETTLRYDGRFPVELKDSYEAELRDALSGFSEDVILRFLYSANPAYTNPSHQWVQANLQAFGQTKAELPPWTTDGCFFSEYNDGVHKGIPLVIAGPGFLDNLHVPDEKCDTSLILPFTYRFLEASRSYVRSRITNKPPPDHPWRKFKYGRG